MKKSFVCQRRCLVVSAVFMLLTAPAFAQNDSSNSVPVVRLELVDGQATETLSHQNFLDWAEFRVLRTGSLTNELRVFLATDGGARFEEDYKFDRVESGLTILFRAGQSAVNVRLYPIDDELQEGDEKASVRLILPPYMNPLPYPYGIDPGHSSVEMVVHDNDPVIPVVSIRTPRMPETTAEPCPTCLVAPGEIRISRWGSFAEPLTVYLKTDGTATPGVDYRALLEAVTIPAGSSTTNLIVLPFDDLLVEGPEVVRTSIAPDPNGGYVMTRFENEAMVVIRDDEPGATDARLDVVEPRDNAQFPAGSTIELSAISVYLDGEVSRPVEFYADDKLIGQSAPGPLRPAITGMPNVHTIWWTNPPAGQHVITARVQISLTRWLTGPAINLTVGSDPPATVIGIEATQPIAEESSYPLRRLPLRGQFTISRSGPTNNSLPLYVHYSGTATPGVDYPHPSWFVTIPAGSTTIRIEIVPDDDGVTESIETVTAALSDCPPDTDPPLGMPCYGGFTIDARRGRATVYIRDNALETNGAPRVAITRPASGSEFPADASIELVAETVDADGYVPRVEFFADGRKIGEANVVFMQPPDPGQTQTFTFVWRYPSPGHHILTAVATDNAGNHATSAGVEMNVGTSEPLPIVTVTAPDPFAVEPQFNTELNAAAFRIRRHGPTNDALVVAYSLHGTAENGVDYERLSGLATIPAGSRGVVVTIRPLADDLHEGIETVRLRLEEPPPPSTEVRVINPYHVGRRDTAAAAISDYAWNERCRALPEGLVHLCFGAQVGGNFRIEATTDFQTWEALFDTRCWESAWHFIDTETASYPQRFYRITPEPVVDPE
jgi:hypothetical protein